MRNLINFLLRNISWFIFIILELVCFYFIFDGNAYQRSVFLNSTNNISGSVYSVTGEVSSYFGLQNENKELLEENSELKYQLSILKNELEVERVKTDSIKAFIQIANAQKREFETQLARVINNTTNKNINFLTINRGRKDGVTEDMGVISHQGIVGVVRSVSENYSVIQSVLNPLSKFSCKIVDSNAFGTLVWNGKNPHYAEVIDYPKSEVVTIGDTVISSGFSEIFPEGIMIGQVEEVKEQSGNGFYNLKVKLATNFNTLRYVILINSKDRKEILELEKKIKNV